MKYHGSCHCGKVEFDVEMEIDGAISCNCSICSRRGSLLSFTARSNLTMLTPEENLATYTFNKHAIKHRFCKTCGILPFGEAIDPQGKAGVAINIRCLENLDLGKVAITEWDGRSA
jgi:hypothetical protein